MLPRDRTTKAAQLTQPIGLPLPTRQQEGPPMMPRRQCRCSTRATPPSAAHSTTPLLRGSPCPRPRARCRPTPPLPQQSRRPPHSPPTFAHQQCTHVSPLQTTSGNSAAFLGTSSIDVAPTLRRRPHQRRRSTDAAQAQHRHANGTDAARHRQHHHAAPTLHRAAPAAPTPHTTRSITQHLAGLAVGAHYLQPPSPTHAGVRRLPPRQHAGRHRGGAGPEGPAAGEG